MRLYILRFFCHRANEQKLICAKIYVTIQRKSHKIKNKFETKDDDKKKREGKPKNQQLQQSSQKIRFMRDYNSKKM